MTLSVFAYVLLPNYLYLCVRDQDQCHSLTLLPFPMSTISTLNFKVGIYTLWNEFNWEN